MIYFFNFLLVQQKIEKINYIISIMNISTMYRQFILAKSSHYNYFPNHDIFLPNDKLCDELIWIITSRQEFTNTKLVNDFKIDNLYVIIDIPDLSNVEQIRYKNMLKSNLNYQLSDKNLFIVNKIYDIHQIIRFITKTSKRKSKRFIINWNYLFIGIIMSLLIVTIIYQNTMINKLRIENNRQDITINNLWYENGKQNIIIYELCNENREKDILISKIYEYVVYINFKLYKKFIMSNK